MVDAKPKSVRGRFATRRESGIADSDLKGDLYLGGLQCGWVTEDFGYSCWND